MFSSFTIGSYHSAGYKLGEGSYSHVFLGWHTETLDRVAIKVIDVTALSQNHPSISKRLESEIRLVRTLSHPNVVELKDVLENVVHGHSMVYLVFEYCNLGDLSTFLKKYGPLDESWARFYMQQLVSGLYYLFQNSIVHRDLKPQNLLLSNRFRHPLYAQLKIADFGFARSIGPESLAETLCGSPLYMAPEILSFSKYSSKADLWSLGVVFYECLAGRPPVRAKNHYDLLVQLKTQRIRLPSGWSPQCKDLLKGLLRKNDRDRWTMEEVFCHPWLQMDGYSCCVEHALVRFPSFPSGPSFLSGSPPSPEKEFSPWVQGLQIWIRTMEPTEDPNERFVLAFWTLQQMISWYHEDTNAREGARVTEIYDRLRKKALLWKFELDETREIPSMAPFISARMAALEPSQQETVKVFLGIKIPSLF